MLVIFFIFLFYSCKIFADENYVDSLIKDKMEKSESFFKLEKENASEEEILDPVVNTEYILNYSNSALQQGMQEVAIKILEDANVDKNEKHLQQRLAMLYFEDMQFKRSADLYITLLKAHPGNINLIYGYIRSISAESPRRAIVIIHKIAESLSQFPSIFAHLGYLYFKINELTPAAKYYSRAIELDPNNLAYLYNLAIILDHLKDFDNALFLYRRFAYANYGQNNNNQFFNLDFVNKRIKAIESRR